MNRCVTLGVVGLASVIVACSQAPSKGGVKILSHTAGIAFTSFTDPKENAFSLDVPKNWRVQGGLFRFAPVDTRPAVEIVSPDGAIRVTTGDPRVPTFAIPTQMLAFTGFREGSVYSPGYGVNMLVRRYQPGVQFAEDYVRTAAAQQAGCSDVRFTSQKDRADLAQAINAIYQQFGAGLGGVTRLDMGEVRFTCSKQGAPMEGYYFAGTLIMTTQAGGIWHVDHLFGYTAPAAQAPLAETVMLHMIKTAKQNPEWMRMQSNITMNTSRIVARTNDEISSTMRATFENRWRTESEIMRKDANARRGTTDLIDPDTGERWTVESGSNHFWHKPGSEVIVGTNTYDPPGVGYVPLREY